MQELLASHLTTRTWYVVNSVEMLRNAATRHVAGTEQRWYLSPMQSRLKGLLVTTAMVAACQGASSSETAVSERAHDAASADATSGGCKPAGCKSSGAECGTAPDSCGGQVSCGACASGEFCGGAGPNRCGSKPCVPKTCAELGEACGLVSDGCASALTCGLCDGGGAGGTAGTGGADGNKKPDASAGGSAGGSGGDGCYIHMERCFTGKYPEKTKFYDEQGHSSGKVKDASSCRQRAAEISVIDCDNENKEGVFNACHPTHSCPVTTATWEKDGSVVATKRHRTGDACYVFYEVCPHWSDYPGESQESKTAHDYLGYATVDADEDHDKCIGRGDDYWNWCATGHPDVAPRIWMGFYQNGDKVGTEYYRNQ